MATPQSQSNVIVLQPVQPVNQDIIRPDIRYLKFHRGYGIILMAFAVLTIFLEAIRLGVIVNNSGTYYFFRSGVGIWSGIFMFIPGILSYFASTKSSRSCLAGGLAMDIVGIIIMCTALGLAIPEISATNYNGYGNYYSSDYYRNRNYQAKSPEIGRLEKFHKGVSGYMIIISSILFFVMIVHSSLCYKDVCTACCSACCGCCRCFGCCCDDNMRPSRNTGPVQYIVQYPNAQSTQNTSTTPVQYVIQIPSTGPNSYPASIPLQNNNQPPLQFMPSSTIPTNNYQPPSYSEANDSKPPL